MPRTESHHGKGGPENSDRWGSNGPIPGEPKTAENKVSLYHSRVENPPTLAPKKLHLGPRSCSVWEQLSEICSLSQTISSCLRGKLWLFPSEVIPGLHDVKNLFNLPTWCLYLTSQSHQHSKIVPPSSFFLFWGCQVPFRMITKPSCRSLAHWSKGCHWIALTSIQSQKPRRFPMMPLELSALSVMFNESCFSFGMNAVCSFKAKRSYHAVREP